MQLADSPNQHEAGLRMGDVFGVLVGTLHAALCHALYATALSFIPKALICYALSSSMPVLLCAYWENFCLAVRILRKASTLLCADSDRPPRCCA